MNNASECKISDNRVTNISATGTYAAYGIKLSSSSGNSFDTSTVYNLSAYDYAIGISLDSSSDNNSFDTSTVYNLSAANRNAYGILLSSSSDNNTFTSGSISDINASTWWDFYSTASSRGNSAEDITISSFPTTISFTYDNGIKLKSVQTPPADPADKRNIGKYVYATEVTANSWIFLNVSYEDGDLGGVDENSLRMWKHNGTDWTEVPGTNGVNTAENYVYANITEFGSIFAPLGNVTGAKAPNITSFAPPSPVNDTVCNWRRFNVTVNQTVNVSWYLNESFLFKNESVREANYTLHAEVAGEHNVSAKAENANGTDMQTWVWNVTGAVPPAPLGISVNKVANPPDVAPSSNVEFTITIPNTGDCTLDPVRVVDTLPAWMSYVSSSPAADTHDGTIIWNNVGPLDPGASKTISLVARIASDASGTLTNAVTVTGTSSTGEEVTDSDTVTVTVLAKTIEPPTQTLIDVTTEIKSDGIVIEDEQFGWETGNGNLLNNPPLSPGEAVGGIKYDEKMIGSNGTTEFTKNFGVNTNVTPNLAVTKDIGYKSGDLGSLSYDEQVGMRYAGASPPLSPTTKCEEVNAYSKMVVTDVEAATETEVGITETDERDLHYGIDAEGKGTVSAGVDASVEDGRTDMTYKDESIAYSNFTFSKEIGYNKPP